MRAKVDDSSEPHAQRVGESLAGDRDGLGGEQVVDLGRGGAWVERAVEGLNPWRVPAGAAQVGAYD